jgi:IPT/TIG domain
MFSLLPKNTAKTGGLQGSICGVAVSTHPAALHPHRFPGTDQRSASAGGPPFTLTVNGQFFVNGSTVQWNGSPLATSYADGNHLNASVPAKLIAAQGNASITVQNPGGLTSNAVTFPINAPSAPTLSSLSPNSTNAGGPAFTLTVNGSGFVSGATVLWNGSGRMRRLERGDDPGLCPYAYKVWANGIDGDYRIAIELPAATMPTGTRR